VCEAVQAGGRSIRFVCLFLAVSNRHCPFSAVDLRYISKKVSPKEKIITQSGDVMVGVW